jgi:hypothetical protein
LDFFTKHIKMLAWYLKYRNNKNTKRIMEKLSGRYDAI